MTNRSDAVERFLRELEHSRKDEVESLRSAILAAHSGISERIKWNAPSFCFKGDDRVTFKLKPRDCVQLIFHRGAKVKSAGGFSFEDRSGLLTWAAEDRAVVTLRDMKDVTAKQAALVQVVVHWMEATSA
ncbi:hypothetical protein A176_005325 [Myxococcus hansupus]|uniref:YdhG-like domain-containing protein n=1 Tax=Pseudomyxococcus hansupus TaxID=1297742 RepID=A0A0H4X3E6_9BACT|nr:DUF1801 domain-containing protein [Myxococcus hansupus]AKQ68413.1 hypothetical protein A176_005325 [Myxococcus hansupus]